MIWIRELFQLILKFQSAIFVVVGALLGAWLSRRSELMRLRVERRTKIFDEACKVAAESSLLANHIYSWPADRGSSRSLELQISRAALDRKIATHFSSSATAAWRAVYSDHRKSNASAFARALDSHMKQFTEQCDKRQPDDENDLLFKYHRTKYRETNLEKERENHMTARARNAFNKAVQVALDAIARELK